jgi:nudix-type nucleoside diphosphatase (YffH/AdpP family)
MPHRSITIEAVKTLFEGWNAFHRVTVKLTDDDGHTTVVTHSVEAHGEGVAVLPYDPAKRVTLLVRQMRTPVAFAYGGGATLEVPCGGRGEDEPERAARRELMEEVGIEPSQLELIGAGFPMPGVSTELTHLYLAEYGEADRKQRGGGVHEDGERIEVVEMSLDELAKAIKNGGVQDLKAITLLYALQARRPDLFSER